MKMLKTMAIVGASAVILSLASTDTNSQGTCNRGGNHTIQVSEGADGMPALKYRGGSAEEVHVCNGDQLQWVLTGSDREYFVDFMGEAPFPGAVI